MLDAIHFLMNAEFGLLRSFIGTMTMTSVDDAAILFLLVDDTLLYSPPFIPILPRFAKS